VSAKRRKLEFDWSWLRSWFDLTGQERWFVGGILAIALVGLFARYLHLRSEKPAPYRPAVAEASAYKGAP
jgi:hypothetical protein